MIYNLGFRRILRISIFIIFLFNFTYVCNIKYNVINKKNVSLVSDTLSCRERGQKWWLRKTSAFLKRNSFSRIIKWHNKIQNNIGHSQRPIYSLNYIPSFNPLLLLKKWEGLIKKKKINHNFYEKKHNKTPRNKNSTCHISEKEDVNDYTKENNSNIYKDNEHSKKQYNDNKDGDILNKDIMPIENSDLNNEMLHKSNIEQKNVRNFCILAHIDSGKSTLADRFLELTNTIKKKKMQDQFLDMMALERERGITIKLKAVRMNYKNYIFNLIDTPGHFDFYHEVKRSLNVCEGAILLIDGGKGIQAQTLNIFLEIKKHNIKIIPVINKIDLNTCIYDKICEDLVNKFDFKKEEILKISAKYGNNVENVFQRIITDIPHPPIQSNTFFRGIVFDSFYDQYKGVILIVKVLNGFLKKKQKIYFINSKKTYIIQEVGYLTPNMKPTDIIYQGDIAYISSNIRNFDDIEISETIINHDVVQINEQQKKIHINIKKSDFYSTLTNTDQHISNTINNDVDNHVNINFENKENENLINVKEVQCNTEYDLHNLDKKEVGIGTGTIKEVNQIESTDTDTDKIHEKNEEFEEINIKDIAADKIDIAYPSVYCNIYSVNDKKCKELEVALNKLKLNDTSFSFKTDICETLGKGFKCGFNGLLHLNIIQERIKREYNVETIITAPSVNYLVKVKEKYIDKRLKAKLIEKNFDINSINIDDGNSESTKKEASETKTPSGMFFMTSNSNDIPQKNYIEHIYEPYVKTNIITPEEYQKHIMNECFKRRGIFIKKEHINDQIIFTFDMPLSEILINFLDEIKSSTKGFGSMSYENYIIYKQSDLYKVHIYINNKCIESLTFIAHKLNYQEKSKAIVSKLKSLINPHQFLIVIQAAIGSNVFVSEKIKPLKKNVTAKCYGGDITRRRKLLEKQNEGKKKMFTIGKVKLPPGIFTKLFNIKDK
ncbi:GTP-binding protein, putative [Plasmodium vinckei vinckei]|uniref:Translation factor GUF1 homolog, mitochondrial n=1 Tax=Plasmodium vinckei vinckei TaxID=54757 RepID=A0A449BTR5_PLAVN|nr:GTP-binding protein, putative [Plasmodium vinckei vinckei]KEG03001.1 translation factor GUF1 like, mitochondrial [Plasmodium vinckei vinckei]VEV56803.1 GTP-binding protein, putative [Plasmodium vinckei vinckei]